MTFDHLPTYLYLMTTGWKTGHDHEIEIWYVPYEGRYYLVSEMREQSHWVKNIQHNAQIRFRVGDQTFDGVGRVVDRETETQLTAAVCQLMDARYDWSDGLIVELMPEI